MGKAGKNKKSLMFEKILRHRVKETYGTSIPSIDKLIDGLRAKYPEYGRYRHQLFTRMVKQTLDVHNNNDKKRKLTANYEEDDDVMSRSSASKKAKKIETKGREIELQTEPSELELSSTHTVLIFENESQQFEPGFDFTKSMLRNKYSGSTIRKNIELEPMVKAGSRKSNNNGPRFEDIGGMDDVLDHLEMEVIVPLLHPDLYPSLGLRATAGVLLHGPPGCGKTLLARAIANESGASFYKISAPELVSGVSGESEENIRELFSKANRTAPSIVFIDEIDAIASKRENLQREMEKRIVTQLMTCMDESHRTSKPDDALETTEMPNGKPGYVLVIGATNRPDALDPALRRPGRFDLEISLGAPNEDTRLKILSVLTRDKKLEGDFDLIKIARSTPGFVGADLDRLVNTAGGLAIRRVFYKRKLELPIESIQNKNWLKKAWTHEEHASYRITTSDFEAAAKLVQPSSKREGFTSIPNVKWEDIGGLHSLRREFYTHIISRIKYPDECEDIEDDLETGFLLYGPPGCGKTLIAKAVANEAGANFIHIKGPELLNKYVGESELAVRTHFSRARTCSPCILFFDEVDAITTKRETEGNWVATRVVHQFLTELDGGDQRKGVYVIGATNKPDAVDSALLRPGRFGENMYVSLPNQDERVLILKALSKNRRLDADVDLIAIAQRCANFSGADLSKLMKKASLAAHEERISKIIAAGHEGTSLGDTRHIIKAVHFERVFRKVSPSVSEAEKQYYDRLAKHFGES
ncbi:putative AAA+ ATPase domain, ATPase, AAA-type, core, AAA ATPase, AAA+ lid domain-containing protein [Helianthus annuus]|nr:putative AAA+ ATPase domain, ATPase, AAA-type, core, AAA ATPase, AAA+ lid domain-containing protein [Helianthus annuus]